MVASHINQCCAKHDIAMGVWGMPPRKILKIRYSEIDSGGIFTKNLR